MLRSIPAALVLGAALVFGASAPADALSLGFECIVGSASACALGESQLSLEVNDIGGGQVEFVISNSGPEQATIQAVFFRVGVAFEDIASIVGSPDGTDFVEGYRPAVLPGGMSLGFNKTVPFAITALSPAPKHGVNPGGSVTVTFDLADGISADDVFRGLLNGELLVGLHLIAGEGGSFVTVPREVPEPAALGLLALGGLALAARKRRST